MTDRRPPFAWHGDGVDVIAYQPEPLPAGADPAARFKQLFLDIGPRIDAAVIEALDGSTPDEAVDWLVGRLAADDPAVTALVTWILRPPSDEEAEAAVARDLCAVLRELGFWGLIPWVRLRPAWAAATALRLRERARAAGVDVGSA